MDPEQSSREAVREVGVQKPGEHCDSVRVDPEVSRKGAVKKALEVTQPDESHESVHVDPKLSRKGAVKEVDETSRTL